MLRVTVILLFASSIIFSQTELNLKYCLDNAIKKNSEFIKLANSIEAQEGNIKQSYGSLLPTLSLNGGWSRTNQVNGSGTINIGGIFIPTPSQNQNNFNYTLGVRSDVTLFNGFANYDNIDLQKQNQAVLYTQMQKLEQDIALKTIASYITVLKNLRVVKVNEATLADSRTQYERVKAFVDVGKRSRVDLSRQDVVVAQNELALEQANNQFSKSIVELASGSNLPLDKNYSVNEEQFFSDISLDYMKKFYDNNSNLSRLTQVAALNRKDYKALLQYLDVYSTSLDITRSNLIFPTLSGYLSYNLSAPKIKDISDSRIFTVGLSLSYPILQGFQVDNQRQQAEIKLLSANEDLKQMKRQIELDLKKVLLDVESLIKQMEITERTLKASELDKTLAEESYRAGLGTLLEFETATTKHNNALIESSNQVYNFILAQKQLEYYQGILKY